MATIGHAVLPIIAGLQFNLDKLKLGAMLFFAFLPDVDVLISFALTGNPFALHRQFTHSLLFAFLPLAIYVFARRAELLWGFAGAITHPLIDMLDTHGCPLFWPLTDHRYGLGLWRSTSAKDLSVAGVLSPDSFLSDKLLLALLIVYLAYYFGSRWFSDTIKR